MPDFELRYLLLGGLAIALLIAAITDVRSRHIDNRLNAAIALSAPLYWWASGLSLWPGVGWQLGVAALTFVICTALFAVRAMGGGDVKLLTALALWIEPMQFLKLVIGMALIGGVLTVVLGAWHIARRRRDKLAIPYGVAISSSGIWVLATQFMPAAHMISSSTGAG